MIHAIEKISKQDRVVVHDIRFQAPPTAGPFSMDLHLLSDCYLGLDEEIELTFNVLPAAELPAYAPHPDDQNLDNVEPTLFEQMLNSNMDDDSSDDDDDDEMPALVDTPENKTENKKVGARERPEVDSDNDDSDRD